ncbi:MAG: ATP-binding protein [Acidobacteriia bacterium]|nr:ATP-binding protein [Terriglobia bacterium]
MDRTFSGFTAHTERLSEKVRFIRNWTSSDLGVGLYLFGSVGTGKTHLAVAAMRELIKRGLRGRFINARRFILLCQTAFGRRESAEEVVYEILDTADFLILDDFGSEKATDYVRQSLLHLVDECYTREIVLVVTSNIDFEALNQIDERIASRLMEMCDRVKFSEQDYRVRIAKNRRGSIVEEVKDNEKNKRTRTLERLARRWPQDDESCREAFWALAGMLLRAEWNPDDVVDVVIELATLTGHSEPATQEHAADVELTAERLDSDEPTFGAPTMAGLIGWDAVDWIRAGLVRDYSAPIHRRDVEAIVWPPMQTDLIQ